MPKKYQPNFSNYTKHGTVGSSTSLNAGPKSPSTRSVNERLEQLRREQAPRPSKEKWNDLSTIATAKTVPPHLRHILALPETTPVRPRRGLGGAAGRTYGQPRRVADPRVAGPPPPSSWVEASMHAPAGTRAKARREMKLRLRERAEGKVNAAKLRCRPNTLSSLSRLPDTPHPLPVPGSLKHYALKALAENWDWLADYEANNLATLPIYLKSSLLTYLSLYGPDDDISLASLKILFLTESALPGATGSSGLRQLDLSSLLNHQLTSQQMFRYMTQTPDSVPLNGPMSQLRLDGSHDGEQPINNLHESTRNAVVGVNIEDSSGDEPDSWEDLLGSDIDSPPLPIALTRFASLTRLSLAHAGAYASWSTLLSFAPHLNKITHLSLAGWPAPTMTPNSRTTFVQARHAEINLGGSHIYSVIDDDWDEAANILRRLSKETYSLQWLDLEGCADWLPALTWEGMSGSTPDRWVDRAFGRARTGVPQVVAPVADISFDQMETANTRNTGPDWNGTWSQVTYVNIAQGSMPQNVTALRRLPAGRIGCDLLLYLRDLEDVHDDVIAPIEDCDIPQWLESEKVARRVAVEVHLRRTKSKGKYCVFDHGWKIPAPVRRQSQEPTYP